ncbi:MAG: Gfo/Idh/MocA family oxidoreductase, partial [Candidatus Glassbacteria bacterium]|nr:Gfo/Idh/MocA family oxidoreductase [Candidatus Glassbacteria bacterium]
MQEDNSLTRREFLGRTTLLASAASLAAGAGKTRAQLNNGAVPPPSRVGVGVIGTGVRGTELLQASRNIFGVDLVAACDLYKGHLDRALELTGGGISTTGEYQDVLARREVDAVIVAVPDHWHRKVLLDAVAAGKHVYVEKPLTHKLEEGDEMVRAVEKSQKVVQVGSQCVSLACTQKARELIGSGKLGKVTLVDAEILRYSSLAACYYPIPPDASARTVDWERFLGEAPRREFDPKRFFQWRLFWDYSGGLCTDLFVHLISATHYIMGVREPESVACLAGTFNWKNYREVPDQLCALVNYPQGFQLKLTTSVNNGHQGPVITFYGTEGTLEYGWSWLKYYYQPMQEAFGYATHSWAAETADRYREIMGLDEKMRPLAGRPAGASEPMEYSPSGGDDEDTAHLRSFYDAVRTGAKPAEDVRFGNDA